MTETVTDFHNNLLPRGEEKFKRATIDSGTTYTASGVLLLEPSGSNVTYLLHDIHFYCSDVEGTMGNSLTASSSNDPSSEEYSISVTDVPTLALHAEKGSLYAFTKASKTCLNGRLVFQPMFRMDASAGQSFLIEIDGTPTTDVELLLRYCKVDTRDV